MSYAYDAALAAAAMQHVRSVDYKVGLRWVFYRLLQDGLLSNKGDYTRLKDILSTARKDFRDDWRPDTLVDGGRSITESDDPRERSEMLLLLPYYIKLKPDLFAGQDVVPFIVYEAATSDGQFNHFAPWCDRAALRGDASIPHKWEIAKRCDSLAERYDVPVHILYFGDFDPKGLQIPESAMDDVRKWAAPETEIHFTRCGINAEHASRFNLPEKPEKPGTYEWESLASEDAGALIGESLAGVIDVAEIRRRQQSAAAESLALRAEVETALEAV